MANVSDETEIMFGPSDVLKFACQTLTPIIVLLEKHGITTRRDYGSALIEAIPDGSDAPADLLIKIFGEAMMRTDPLPPNLKLVD